MPLIATLQGFTDATLENWWTLMVAGGGASEEGRGTLADTMGGVNGQMAGVADPGAAHRMPCACTQHPYPGETGVA